EWARESAPGGDRREWIIACGSIRSEPRIRDADMRAWFEAPGTEVTLCPCRHPGLRMCVCNMRRRKANHLPSIARHSLWNHAENRRHALSHRTARAYAVA